MRLRWNIEPWQQGELPYFKFGYEKVYNSNKTGWKTMQGRLYLGFIHLELD